MRMQFLASSLALSMSGSDFSEASLWKCRTWVVLRHFYLLVSLYLFWYNPPPHLLFLPAVCVCFVFLSLSSTYPWCSLRMCSYLGVTKGPVKVKLNGDLSRLQFKEIVCLFARGSICIAYQIVLIMLFDFFFRLSLIPLVFSFFHYNNLASQEFSRCTSRYLATFTPELPQLIFCQASLRYFVAVQINCCHQV